MGRLKVLLDWIKEIQIYKIHNLANLSEEELEEAQEELEILIRAELEWREECKRKDERLHDK